MTLGSICRIKVIHQEALDYPVIHSVPMKAWYERLKLDYPEVWEKMEGLKNAFE